MRCTRWAWSRDVREWKGDGHRGCITEGLQASQVGKEVFVDGGALDELEGVDVWEQVQIVPGGYAREGSVVPVVYIRNGFPKEKRGESCALQQMARFCKAMADFVVGDPAGHVDAVELHVSGGLKWDGQHTRWQVGELHVEVRVVHEDAVRHVVQAVDFGFVPTGLYD